MPYGSKYLAKLRPLDGIITRTAAHLRGRDISGPGQHDSWKVRGDHIDLLLERHRSASNRQQARKFT